MSGAKHPIPSRDREGADSRKPAPLRRPERPPQATGLPHAGRRSRPELLIEEITETRQFEALAPEWDALWERLPAATPFQSPGWLLPWWRHVFAGGKLWALALREDGRLTGLAPFFIYGLRERTVAILGAGISDYPDVLVEPESAAAIFGHLARRASEWDVCNFQDLRPGSPMLSCARTEELESRAEVSSLCPVIPLRGAAAEPRSLRRARRRLEKNGARFEEANAETIGEFMEALFRLHTARWHSRGELGMVAEPALREFYREAAAALARRGMLRLYGLRAGSRLLAVLYGFAAHGRFYAYLSGFDPAAERFSPGVALLAMAVERSIAEGLREFDLLRKRESYKYQWGAVDQANRRLLLWHSPVFARTAA